MFKLVILFTYFILPNIPISETAAHCQNLCEFRDSVEVAFVGDKNEQI